MSSRPRRTWALVAAAVALTACGGGNEPDQVVPSTWAGRFCAAVTTAASGDKDGAVELFDHGPLHDLAQRVTEVDRALAARLLEAKQRVEANSVSPAVNAEGLALDLVALTNVTRDAQEAVGDPVLPDCTKEKT